MYFDFIQLLFAVLDGDDSGVELFRNSRLPISEVLQNALDDGFVLLELD